MKNEHTIGFQIGQDQKADQKKAIEIVQYNSVYQWPVYHVLRWVQ